MAQNDAPKATGGRLAVLSDLCGLIGAGLVSYGAWLVYEPAGYIVGGAMLLTVGVVSALRRGA
ncbi:hypothetical protein [Azospirillum sp.]|uniref:hypothetical protein n=1 Tax=Azospirillum sp. TaxID=34012 RepID=UPI003D7336BE